MLGGAVGAVGMNRLCHLLCGDFSVLMGHPKHLMSRGFHGSGFMDIDVGSVRAKGTLMWAQSGINHRQICLGSAHEEMDGNILPAALFPYFGSRSRAVLVLTVAQGLLHVGLHQSLKHFFVAAFAVIIVKVNHCFSHSCISLFYFPAPPLSRVHSKPLRRIVLFR